MTSIRDLVIRGSDILEEGKFKFDRSKYLNGSEAMTCLRRQWYKKFQPEEEAEQDWGYARRGIHGERFLVESLIAANVPLTMSGKEQMSWQDEKRRISSTPDGVIQYDDEWVMPEFKTIDPRTNKSKLPRVPHVAQLQIAMEMIDLNIDRPDGVGLRGLLIYMDASNYFDILEFPIDRDKTILDKMAKRASKILRTKDVGNLDREGKRGGGNECKTMCGFSEVCGVDVEAASTRRANRGSNFDGCALRYMELKDAEDVIKVEKATLQEEIKNGLKQRSTNRAVVGNIEVLLSIAKGRASLDKAAVKRAGIDLSPFEQTGQPSERLTVKRT